MARPEKRRIESGQSSGRTTAKGTRPGTSTVAAGDKPGASSRYTPPASRAMHKPSPMIVPILMFACFGIGLLMIVLNYAGVMPGAAEGSSWYILGGLSLILLGIITATQYH